MGLVALKEEHIPRYTYEDYCQWEGKWEVISGIAYAMTPAPSLLHQSVSQNISGQLFKLLENCKNCHALLPVDWQITEDTIVQPDHLIVCGKLPRSVKLTTTPSLIFEILSESTRRKDENLKFKLFEAAGVLYYCLVDPEKQIAKLFKLENGRYEDQGTFERNRTTITLPTCALNFDFDKIWV